MSDLVRFGVSLEKRLIDPFDRLIAKEGYTNRSEAFRDLIRERLIRDEERKEGDMFGTLTLIYDHHQRGLDGRLNEIQHQAADHVVSAVHVHINPDNCLLVLILRGPASALRKVSGRLKSLHGVKHGSLSLTTTGSNLV